MSTISHQQIRILHVDDEPDFVDLTGTFLQREDDRFAIETATSADEGLDRLADRPPDCVVSDYNMPGMDGLGFLQIVREEYPDLPVILFTGKGSEAVASEAISAGVTDYIQKQSGTHQFELLANRIERAVDQYHTERELERQNDLFAKAQAIATIGAWAHDLGSGDLIWTDQVYEIHGVSKEFDLTPDNILQLYHPDDRPELRDAVERAITTGQPYDLEVRMTARDDAVRWIRTVADPQIEDGNVVRVRGIVHDITDRKERERRTRQQREQLERREEKLIRLRDYTQELEYAETRSETANIALRAVDEILGFDLGAVFAQSETQEGLLELVGVLNRPRMEKMYGGLPAFVRDAPPGTHSALAWDVFETGESVFINDTAESETLTRKSPFGSLMMYPVGRHGIVLLAATRMDAFTETEEILLDLLATALETAFDRLQREDDLRSQRDELERQNERLDKFASVISHDLRNPLNVATGRLQMATDECESDHLDDVAGALDRMGTLIDDLRALTRRGEPASELEPSPLADLVESCWETVATEDATLVVDTDATILAERSRLKQLLENLIRNAVDHGGTDVTVTIRDVPGGFYVDDDGTGIAPDRGDRVFESGYSTTADGTGFGLAIVQEIVETHGWTVSLTDSETGGARFEITGVEFVD